MSYTKTISINKQFQDMVSDLDCNAAFKSSTAYRSSTIVKAEAVSKNWCYIEADCTYENGTKIKRSTATIKYDEVPLLNNCDGNLRKGNCP